MNTTEINKKKIADARYDPSMNKYNDVVLFPDKLAKANENIKKLGYPDLSKKKK